jgi:hypothetical protein
MTPGERDAYLSQPRNAILATVGADGRSHAVPVWFRYESGAFEIITERGSVKHRNVANTGRATICVDDGKFAYVSAEGPVQVQDTVASDLELGVIVVEDSQPRSGQTRDCHSWMYMNTY